MSVQLNVERTIAMLQIFTQRDLDLIPFDVYKGKLNRSEYVKAPNGVTFAEKKEYIKKVTHYIKESPVSYTHLTLPTIYSV